MNENLIHYYLIISYKEVFSIGIDDMKSFVLVFVTIFSVIIAQNHPNSVSISRAVARWDGTYPIKIIVLGDNANVNRIFLALVSQICAISESVLFVMTTGDHAAGGDSGGYARYLAVIDTLPVPWITVMGNHEIDDSLGWYRFERLFGSPDFFFDVGNYRFVALTDCYPAPAPVSLGENVYYKFTHEQLSWLDSVLSSWSGFAIVFVHVPPYLRGHFPYDLGCVGGWGYSPPRDESLTEQFTRILRDHNVLACFAGHLHCYDNYTPNDTAYGAVHYIITGGAGGPLNPWIYRAPYGGAMYHMLMLELEEDGTIRLHIIRPDTVDDGIIEVTFDSLYEMTLTPSEIFESGNDDGKFLTVYPNPTTGVLNFNRSPGQVEIYNLRGELVYRRNIIGRTVDFAHLNIPNGVYVVKTRESIYEIFYIKY